jgi:adenylate kinase family enzyme
MLIKKTREMLSHCRVLIELGKNNSGKGTCATILKILLELAGYTCHIVPMSKIIGGHIKKFQSEPTHKLGELLAIEIEKQNRGELMSDEPVIQALLEYLIELNPAPDSILIFDGFPRTTIQWNVLLRICPHAEFSHHEASDEIVRHRAHIRFVKEGRNDDKPVEVNRRLSEYYQFTEPVVRSAKRHGRYGERFKKIESTWTIREQITTYLRFLGFYGKALGEMTSCFDNPKHEVSKIVKEIEAAERTPTQTKSVGTNVGQFMGLFHAVTATDTERPHMRGMLQPTRF